MTKRTRQEVEDDKGKNKKYVSGGAKALGSANILDLILELLLDIKDELMEIKEKLP